jgi:uncharacterized protein YjbJ (UPF0337 family)
MQEEDVKKQQVQGQAQTIKGRIKQAWNRLVGNHRGELEGGMEEIKGRAKAAKGKVSERIENAVQEAREKLSRSKSGDGAGSTASSLEERAKEAETNMQEELRRQQEQHR